MNAYNEEFLILDRLINKIRNKLIELDKINKTDLSNLEGINKVINIIKNKDKNGVKNIDKYLGNDVRLIYDMGINDDDLYKQIDLVCNMSRKIMRLI